MKLSLLYLLSLLYFVSGLALSESQCACSCQNTKLNEVGRSGWHFIHSLAANYPEKPIFREKYSLYGFFDSIINFYPCEKCRKHLLYNINKHGLRKDNKTDLNMFVCYLHNEVNKQQGRELFPCNIDLLIEKYGIK